MSYSDSDERLWYEHFNSIVRANIDKVDWMEFVNDPNFNCGLIDLIPINTHLIDNLPDGTTTTIERYKNRELWKTISGHKTLTLDIVKKNPHRPWNISSISKNISISLDEILSNLDVEWGWDAISDRSDVTLDFVKAHPEINWCFYYLSQNIDLNSILTNPDYAWYVYNVTARASMDKIREYPLFPWAWNMIISNKKLDMSFLTKQDINSGWDIYAIIYELKIIPRMIEQRFPMEFHRYNEYRHSDSYKPWSTVINDSYTQLQKESIEKTMEYLTELIFDDTFTEESSLNTTETRELFIKNTTVEKYLFMENIKIEQGKKSHQEKLKTLHIELASVIFRPDNLQYAKDNGLFQDYPF